MAGVTTEILSLLRNNREAFETSETIETFIGKLPPAQAGRAAMWLYTPDPRDGDRVWRMAKAHGLDACPNRVLYLPEATRIAELVCDVCFLPLPPGGLHREQARAAVGDRMFVVSHSARDVVPFGQMGGKRDWSPDWLARGEKIRRHSGGKFYGTYAQPTAALRKAFDAHTGGELRALELVRRADGRVLCIARGGPSTFSFDMWAAIILPDSCDLVSLMPPEDQQLIADNKAAERAAWGDEPR